jgi:hypothetical protein
MQQMWVLKERETTSSLSKKAHGKGSLKAFKLGLKSWRCSGRMEKCCLGICKYLWLVGVSWLSTSAISQLQQMFEKFGTARFKNRNS